MLLKKIVEKTNNFPNTNIKQDFLDFLEQDESQTTNNTIGHFTGSCWILNSDSSKTLLTHHKKLNIWIPTGGHLEENESPLDASIRESFEETGLKLELLDDKPIYLDIHNIPQYKGILKHKHFDFTYLFRYIGNEDYIISSESHDLKWIKLENISNYTSEKNILDMVKLTLKGFK